jgi:hypothetical protein
MQGERTYRCVVRGGSVDLLAGLGADLTIQSDGDRVTITGAITDQSQLRGMLNEIADLGFELVAFEQL